MDMRGNPQGCSRDFSGTSHLSHCHVRSTSRTIPTEKTERQKSASRHPSLSEDSAHSGAAPVPLGSASLHCHLRVHFLLSVLVRTPSLQCTTSSALQKCSPQHWWPGHTFLRTASGMYFLSTSSTLGSLGKRRAGLMAPGERKCRRSLGGWDYEVLESRGWHWKRGSESLLRLLMLPPQMLRAELPPARRRQQQRLPQLMHSRAKSMSAN